MNFLPLIRTLARRLTSVPKLTMEPITRQIHLPLCGNLTTIQTMNTTSLNKPTTLLQAALPLLNPVCGMKVRGKLKLRCESCYYIARRGRLYVLCKARPSHKQTQMMARTYKTWKLTHATQGKVRGW